MPAIINTHDRLSPELRAEVNRLVENERVRIEHHGREVARYSGVSMSGMGPDPIRVKTADELIRMAEANLARARLFQASPRGRFIVAVARMEREGEYAATADACRAFFGRELADARQPLNVSSIAKTLAALNACDGEAARNARSALCDLLIGDQERAA